VCAIEDCANSHYAEPSIHRSVNWALFSCRSKINPPFQNPGSLPDIAEAMALPLDRIGIKVCAEFLEG